MPKHSLNSNGKAKDFKKAIKTLIGYNKQFIAITIIALCLIIVSTIFRLIGPDKLGEITTMLSNVLKGEPLDLKLVLNIGIFLLSIYGVSFVVTYIANVLIGIMTFKSTQKLREDISKKINALPLKYLDNTQVGDILSRVANDVDTIGQTLNNSVSSLVGSIVMFFGSLIMMFVTNYILALCAIASTIIGFAVMMLIVKKSQKYFIAQQVKLGNLNGIIEESYSGQNVIKTYNATNEVVGKFEKVNNELYTTAYKSQFFSGIMQPLMGFVGNLGYVVVCIVGAVLASKSIIDFGVIVSFMIYIRLFTNPLSQIAQCITSLQSTAAATERVFEFLTEEELEDESNKKEVALNDKVNGNVEFRNVRYGYDENKIIIHNFSANVKAGQKVAIVGPTGAGKTTMVNLLMRFYELKSPKLIVNNKVTNFDIFDKGRSIVLKVGSDGTLLINGNAFTEKVDKSIVEKFSKFEEIKFDKDFNIKCLDKNVGEKLNVITGDEIDNLQNQSLAIAYYGDIFIDGIPTKSLKRSQVSDMFSMVLQDTWLFDGTLKENLVYNKTNVTDEQIDKAINACGLSHFVKTLPKGLDTVLNDNTSVSAGQKQLLTIARAMIQNSPMLILDEATSSVDTRTEEIIQNAMDKLTQNRTSFIIAHRLSTIKNANIILVLKDGNIIEQGNHEQLIEKNGFYAELYNSQFSEN